MKNLLQERGGKWCSKRILAILFGLSAIVGMFIGLDSSVVIAFLTASVGSHTMTVNKLEN